MKTQGKISELRDKLMGLGDESGKKTYYPELQKRLKEVEKAEKKYHSIFENAIEGIFQTDKNGKIININKSFYRMFGYESREEFFDKIKLSSELYYDVEDRKAIIELLFKNKEINKYEVRMKKKNDECIWVSINAKIIIDEEEGEIVEGTLIDVTNERNIKIELKEEKEKAEKASKAKTIFLANMSHEIRTPMNGIVGNIELLKFSNITKEQAMYVRNIDISVSNLLNIINDILDVAKIEEGKYEIEYEAGNVKQMFNEIYEEFKAGVISKGIEFKLYIDNSIPDLLKTDILKLRQVILNLINNAVKFTEKGYIFMALECVKKNNKKITLNIVVEDTGVGISKDKIDEIFEPFVQGDMSYTKKYKGTGLGLAISKKIVELMNGKIILNTKENEGSRFEVEIEFFILQDEKMEEKEMHENEYSEEKIEKIKNTISEKSILVVEDNDIIRETLVILLEHKGYTVLTADNGRKAMDTYKNNKNISLIFMDIQMPVMNGVEATRAIRESEKETMRHVNIIALTAYAMKEDREKFIREGMDDYLSKPVRAEELYEKAKEYI